MMTHLDGNVLAGLLSDVFAVEVTLVRGRCAQCGDLAALAESLVYTSPIGTVARCRSCSNVLMSLVETPDTRRVCMSGLALIEIRRSDG